MRPRILRALAALAVLVAIVAHVLYWYGSRERAAAPDRAGLPARLLASGPFDACLWVPFPHQNLGALAGAAEDWRAWFDAAARLAEAPPPALPSFGPFAVPPSRELAVCSDLDGGRLMAAARVYPLLAGFARLAGLVAGNPWLAGGTFEEADRQVRVAWQGTLWTVASGRQVPPEPPGDSAPGAALAPGLAALRLAGGVGEAPAGTYLLRRPAGAASDLEIFLTGGRPPHDPAPPAAGLPPFLAAAGPDGDRPAAALALFPHRGGPLGLPGAAVFHPPGRERWALPAQGMYRLLRKKLPEGNAGEWAIVALDRASLRQAQALAPRLSRLLAVSATGAPAGVGSLRLAVEADPAATLALVSRVRSNLEKVPLVAREQVRRWRDWETVLAPLARCERLSLAAERQPDAFVLRLHACR